jgi:hypothetical protein
MKQKAILYLMLITTLVLTSFWSYGQDLTETFNIDNHANLVGALKKIQTRMDSYKDLIKNWKNDEVRKKSIDDAVESYGKVQGAMNGLIAKYCVLIDNERPKKIKMEQIKGDFEMLQKEYNSFVTFYKEHKEPKPHFAVTTALVDLVVSFIKTVWEFGEGKLNKLREKYKGQVNDCKIAAWGVQSGGTDTPKPKTETPKEDTIKKNSPTKKEGQQK